MLAQGFTWMSKCHTLRQEYGTGGRWPPVVDMVFLSHDYVRSHFPKDANMLTQCNSDMRLTYHCSTVNIPPYPGVEPGHSSSHSYPCQSPGSVCWGTPLMWRAPRVLLIPSTGSMLNVKWPSLVVHVFCLSARYCS